MIGKDLVRMKYIEYMKQGLDRKTAAKLVQKATGLSAVSGKPLAKKDTYGKPLKTTFRGQYGGK